MKRICAFCMVLFFYFNGNGQSVVRGRLIDSLTKIAMPGASITAYDLPGKKMQQTNSGKDGRFKMYLPMDTYNCTITYIGYKTVIQKVMVSSPEVELATTALLADIKTLKLAKVIATKPLITMSAGKLTMNIAESGLSAGNTAWDMLQQAPGVQGAEEGNISLNGKTVAVYIDSRLQYLKGEQLKNVLSSLQARQIDKLELISNPSARYDAAGAAVISIKTIRLNKPGYNGVLTSGVGSSRYLKYNTGLDMNYKAGSFNVYAGYDYSHNANLYQPLYNRVAGTSKLIYITENEHDYRSRNNHGYKAGLDWNISKHSTLGLLVKGFTNYRNRSVTGHTKMGSSKGITDSVITTNTNGTATFSSPSVNIFYKTSLDTSGEKELVINADYYKYDQQWQDVFITTFIANGSAYQPNQYRRDQSPTILNIYSANVNYTQPLRKGQMEAGFKTSFIRTDNDVRWDVSDGILWTKDLLRTNYFKYNEDINALYVSYTKTYGKWETEAAMRTEITRVKGQSITIDSVFTRNYQDWFPSLGITYTANKSHQWSISYRKSIDRPVYSYVNPFIIFRGQFNYFRGNTNLKPMYSNSWELGYAYKSMLFLNLSYTYTTNTIGSFYTQDNATKVITEFYDNFTNRRSYHLTISFNKPLKKWWTSSNYVSTGLLQFQYNGLAAGAASTVYCYLNSYQSFAIAKWKSKFDISYLYNVPYSSGYYRYKGYGMLNIAYSRDIMKKKGSIRMNVTDLLKTYITSKTILYGGLQNTIENAYDSRAINLAFTYRFGKAIIRRSNRKSSIETETGRIQ